MDDGDAQPWDEAAALRLLMAGNTTLGRLRTTVDYCDLFGASYAITTRLKRLSRLKQKVAERHAEGNTSYSVASVTDIVGARFISLYREDVTDTVRSLCSLLTGRANTNPNYLAECKVREFKVYMSNTLAETDPLKRQLEAVFLDFFGAKGPLRYEPLPRERYSSVHIVATLEQLFDDDTPVIVPIEFQIRSVFEDAWGEIDHKLFYELKRRQPEVSAVDRDLSALHMGVLKRLLDAAAEYADVVRRTLALRVDQPVTIARNMDYTDYVEQLCQILKPPLFLQNEFLALTNAKAELDLQLDTPVETPDDFVSSTEYQLLAERFHVFVEKLEKVGPETLPRERLNPLLYQCRMEEALCRLLSDNTAQVRLAIDLYRGVTADFADLPNCWFRLGQSLARLADEEAATSEQADSLTKESYDAYQRAGECLDKLRNLPDPERFVLISPGQQAYITDNRARLQGFALWRLTDRRRRVTGEPTPSDLDDVIRAYEVTELAIAGATNDNTRDLLANNAVYYGVDAVGLARQLGIRRARLPKTKAVSKRLETLERTTTRSIFFLDTIIRAKEFLKDEQGAIAIAKELLDANVNGDPVHTADGMRSSYVEEMQSRAVQHAWTVVRRGI